MHVPEHLADRHGTELDVQRAWPRDGGRLIFEAVDTGNGRIRAGTIDAAGFARIAPFGEDPVLRGLTPAAMEGDLLVHRYKRRAVVRSDSLYTKFVAPGKAAAVASAHRSVAVKLADSGLTVPRVVTAGESSVAVSAVPGVSLHDLGQRSSLDAADLWVRAWQLWSLRWPRFATPPGQDGGSMPTHNARAEAQTVSRWVDQAVSFDALGLPADRLRRVQARVARALADDPSPAVLAHRDLHDKQLLFDARTSSIGVIDCDTLALAEPALDLANLMVHLDFRVAQGLMTAAASAIGKHYILDAAGGMGVPMGRLRAYASATALRLACIYAFRPPYRDVAVRWFEEVESGRGQSPLRTPGQARM
ncbi:phosphotransferase [Arthrobacter pigmenti]|nr:phosphotransferase [Arthrobacter pigmenti]